MKELLEYLITSIVSDPKKVKINQEEDDDIHFIVRVSKEDVGTVIGSGGKTIRAIKTLLSLKSRGKNFSLEIKEI